MPPTSGSKRWAGTRLGIRGRPSGRPQRDQRAESNSDTAPGKPPKNISNHTQIPTAPFCIYEESIPFHAARPPDDPWRSRKTPDKPTSPRNSIICRSRCTMTVQVPAALAQPSPWPPARISCDGTQLPRGGRGFAMQQVEVDRFHAPGPYGQSRPALLLDPTEAHCSRAHTMVEWPYRIRSGAGDVGRTSCRKVQRKATARHSR
jgi:hypothetical protein